MKTLIFCEGHNDVLFLRKLLGATYIDDEIDFFDQGKALKENRPGAQTSALRSFIQKSYLHKVLIKSENGKEDIFDFFIDSLFLFSQHGIEIVILLDIDNSTVDKKIELLKEKISKRNQFNIDIEERNDIDRVCVLKSLVKINTEEIGKFKLIFLSRDLEDITGINNIDDDVSKITKIDDYISRNRRIKNILYN